jgi:hypothetical protein
MKVTRLIMGKRALKTKLPHRNGKRTHTKVWHRKQWLLAKKEIKVRPRRDAPINIYTFFELLPFIQLNIIFASAAASADVSKLFLECRALMGGF